MFSIGYFPGCRPPAFAGAGFAGMTIGIKTYFDNYDTVYFAGMTRGISTYFHNCDTVSKAGIKESYLLKTK